MLFCPQAVCKTVVPDTFRMLLSQRRRWINSTVHNLSVLVMIRDFWGTFCFRCVQLPSCRWARSWARADISI